ncbi:hypothetical protein [uncultured Piscinibacter sp.]|uniref:hypothetical protein n=1 Tax=uncultured Piscinibacter sp. TaxID=1131835 RepID=UPI002616AB8E|nr:hypothetical protein [uncultured Piscinibacter sp.]
MIIATLLAAPAYAETTVTPGLWDLYLDRSLLQAGLASEQACIDEATRRNVTLTYTCRTRTTVAVTAETTNPPPPPPPPPPTGAVTYSTNFDATELPLSEGGRWSKASNSWTYVRTANGTAYGTNGITNSYDDSVAFLSGFGSDQTIEAVVQLNPGTVGPTHEVELWLRARDDSNNLWGYEVCFWRTGQVQLGVWNGPFGDVLSMDSNRSVPWTQSSPLKTGDRIKAQIVGNTIKAWINDVLKLHVVHSKYTSGQPGIGFFIRPGGSSNLLTLTSVTASSD